MNINLNKKPLAIIPIAIVTIVLILNYIKNPENIFFLPFIYLSAITTIGTIILATKKQKNIIKIYNIYELSTVILVSAFLFMLTIYILYIKAYTFIPISILFWGLIAIEIKNIIKNKK